MGWWRLARVPGIASPVVVAGVVAGVVAVGAIFLVVGRIGALTHVVRPGNASARRSLLARPAHLAELGNGLHHLSRNLS